jgi:CO/xanthine dehydrogenase FAD-binding subunit
MITEYHRPENLAEALALLQREAPLTFPLAGGSVLSRPSLQPFAVVDLQALGLKTTRLQGNALQMGAALSLQGLLDELDSQAAMAGLSAALGKAIRHEASANLRQVASLAGTLVAASGRSPFATAMLALDAALLLQPGDETLALGDLLPLRSTRLSRRLITHLTIPVNLRMAYEYVARTPADQPIVCAAVARWPSGRTRLALGGYGDSPLLVLDGTEPDGAEIAARSAYSQASDEWASAEYRSDIAATLSLRCIQAVAADQ